jgi:hypothetical protein
MEKMMNDSFSHDISKEQWLLLKEIAERKNKIFQENIRRIRKYHRQYLDKFNSSRTYAVGLKPDIVFA